MRYRSIFVLLLFVLSTNVCHAQKSDLSIASERISRISTSEKARAAHTATRLRDGNVLIVGGMRKNGVFYDEAEMFDPRKNTFQTLSNRMTKSRVSHTATLLEDGRVLIAGGWTDRTAPDGSTEIYDPETGEFLAAGNMTQRRSGHSATLLEGGKVLFIGGNNGDRSLLEAEIFDPKTNSFFPHGKMHIARAIHTTTKLNDGRLLVAGGEIESDVITSSGEIFDPKTGEFSRITSEMKEVRYKHDAVLLANGKVLLFGGADSRDRGGRRKSAEIFDPLTATFTPTKDMNFGRFKISETAVLLPNGNVLIAGGSSNAEIFDPESEAFRTVSGNLGKSYHYASVTLLNDGRALIYGGYEFVPAGEPTSTSQAWIFNGGGKAETPEKLEF